MARTRNIKPSFFSNDDLAELSAHTRLLFIGMWTLADKEGRLEDKPRRIQAVIFPYEQIDCNELAAKLQGKKFITRYEVNGEPYIQINNFTKHQNPHPKEQPSTIPEPAEICEAVKLNDEPRKEHSLPCSSFLTSIPSLSNPSLESVSGETPSATIVKIPKPKGSRLEKDWALPTEWGEWALREGLTRQQVFDEEDSFRDHWISKPGQAAVKLDWEATWRNWIRRAKGYGRV